MLVGVGEGSGLRGPDQDTGDSLAQRLAAAWTHAAEEISLKVQPLSSDAPGRVRLSFELAGRRREISFAPGAEADSVTVEVHQDGQLEGRLTLAAVDPESLDTLVTFPDGKDAVWEGGVNEEWLLRGLVFPVAAVTPAFSPIQSTDLPPLSIQAVATLWMQAAEQMTADTYEEGRGENKIRVREIPWRSGGLSLTYFFTFVVPNPLVLTCEIQLGATPGHVQVAVFALTGSEKLLHTGRWDMFRRDGEIMVVDPEAVETSAEPTAWIESRPRQGLIAGLSRAREPYLLKDNCGVLFNCGAEPRL